MTKPPPTLFPFLSPSVLRVIPGADRQELIGKRHGNLNQMCEVEQLLAGRLLLSALHGGCESGQR